MISLGADIGGTGCKCVAFTEAGVQLGQCYAEYGVPPGTVTMPPQILSDSVMQVIRQCVSRLEDPSEVAAIPLSSTSARRRKLEWRR